jgi:hypothetical protein
VLPNLGTPLKIPPSAVGLGWTLLGEGGRGTNSKRQKVPCRRSSAGDRTHNLSYRGRALYLYL